MRGKRRNLSRRARSSDFCILPSFAVCWVFNQNHSSSSSLLWLITLKVCHHSHFFIPLYLLVWRGLFEKWDMGSLELLSYFWSAYAKLLVKSFNIVTGLRHHPMAYYIFRSSSYWIFSSPSSAFHWLFVKQLLLRPQAQWVSICTQLL